LVTDVLGPSSRPASRLAELFGRATRPATDLLRTSSGGLPGIAGSVLQGAGERLTGVSDRPGYDELTCRPQHPPRHEEQQDADGRQHDRAAEDGTEEQQQTAEQAQQAAGDPPQGFDGGS
jgi:hypothetical protein